MAYKIPLFNLNFDEREAQAAYDTIKSGWISTGPKNAELEQMFIDMWGVKYAVSMSNCTSSLHTACMVCGFGPGDEVICPSLTFANILHLANGFLLEFCITYSQDFIYDKYFWFQVGGYGKTKTDHHAGGITFHGCIYIFGYSCKVNNLVKLAFNLNFGHSHDRTIHEDVFTASHLWMKACTNFKQRGNATLYFNATCGWGGDA